MIHLLFMYFMVLNFCISDSHTEGIMDVPLIKNLLIGQIRIKAWIKYSHKLLIQCINKDNNIQVNTAIRYLYRCFQTKKGNIDIPSVPRPW